jgi:hypothetical protein
MSFRLLSYLFLIAVMIQFFLAGYGIMELCNEGLDAHRDWGFAVLHLIPLLMFGAAIWAKMGRVTIGMVVVLFLLVLIQPFFVDSGTNEAWLRALHVVNALLIFMLGYHLTQRAGPMRMPAVEG